MSDLVFDSIAPITVSVSLGGSPYVLKEASGETAVTFRNMVFKYADVSSSGAGKISEGLASIAPMLVSKCLFSSQEDGTLKPVSMAFVNSLPARILDVLFQKAKEISGLDNAQSQEDRDKQAKN